jgi:hypothetical protein
MPQRVQAGIFRLDQRLAVVTTLRPAPFIEHRPRHASPQQCRPQAPLDDVFMVLNLAPRPLALGSAFIRGTPVEFSMSLRGSYDDTMCSVVNLCSSFLLVRDDAMPSRGFERLFIHLDV